MNGYELYQQMVRTPSTSDGTNRLLREFLRFMDAKAQSWAGDRAALKAYVGNTSIVPDIIRVATFEVPSLRSLVPSGRDPRSNDGAGTPELGKNRIHCPPGFMLQEPIFDYIKGLLANELGAAVELSERAAAMGAQHHVVGALDWYRDRDTDNHALHKDTTGSTLFVALHYANEQPILGAEYIRDHWPMPSHKDAAFSYGTRWERPNAPWRTDAQAWPNALVEVLEDARKHLKTAEFVQRERPTVECQEIGPFGLITFVDELIYHATPLAGRRTEEQRKELYTEVHIGGSAVKLPVVGLWWVDKRSPLAERDDYALTRAVSRENMTAPVRDKGKRRFARLWLSIQPRQWTGWQMNSTWS
jgi:hypothetical protein